MTHWQNFFHDATAEELDLMAERIRIQKYLARALY